MDKQTEDILVIADAKDWNYVPTRSVVVDLGVEWDAVDIHEDPRGGVQLYGARSVPEALLSAKEGLRAIWKQRPIVKLMRERNDRIFRARLAGASFHEAGRPFGLGETRRQRSPTRSAPAHKAGFIRGICRPHHFR